MATLTAAGINGQMSVDDNFIVISRKGLNAKFTQGLKGDKRIPMTSVTSVQFKEASALMGGYIQIGILGGVESNSGIIGAQYDENSVNFRKGQENHFSAIRDFIEAKIIERSKPQVITVQTAAPAAAAPSKLDQLKQLGELRDAGILSNEEFEAEKAKIMAS
jgi:hypothetical protein